MKYCKIIISETSTSYYNFDFNIKLVESDNQYCLSATDETEEDISETATEITKGDFYHKISDVGNFARIGIHPPVPPGTGGG